MPRLNPHALRGAGVGKLVSGVACRIHQPDFVPAVVDLLAVATLVRVLAQAQIEEVDAVLGEFCRREPPAGIRSRLEYAVRIESNAATLVELPP